MFACSYIVAAHFILSSVYPDNYYLIKTHGHRMSLS